MTRKRIYLDTLGEVRRALRVLRRIEQSLAQAQRANKRDAAKAAERRELTSLAALARGDAEGSAWADERAIRMAERYALTQADRKTIREG